MVPKVQLQQLHCHICARWWSWPRTEGDNVIGVRACPICRGEQPRNFCCRICGSMLDERHAYDVVEDRAYCPICWVNNNREAYTVETRDDFFYPYVMLLSRADMPAPRVDPTRCGCNICQGRQAPATRARA